MMQNTFKSSPPVIIYCDTYISNNVLSIVKTQLYITDTFYAAEFDTLITGDPTYPQTAKAANKRVLVIRNLHDLTNRDVADIVIYVKQGLLVVENVKVGPPGISFDVDRIYLSKLF